MQHPEFFVGGAGVESFAGFVQAGTPANWGLEGGPLKHFWTVDLQVRLDVTRRLVKSQPPLQYLTLSGDNGGSQPALGVNTQIAEGMV